MQHTTTQPRIAAITPELVLRKSTFMVALMALGGMNTLAGIISSVSAIVLVSEAPTSVMINSVLADVVCNFILGALIFASWKALARGKILTIWLFGSSILLDSFYSLVMGYPMNYIFMGLGLLLIWQMLKHKAELELS